MLRSGEAMATADHGDLPPPKEEVITPSNEERLEFRLRRKKLGLTQQDVATKLGLTAASISNVETGRSRQIEKTFYARLRRLLHMGVKAEGEDQTYRVLVDAAIDLDEREMQIATAMIETIKKTRHSGSR